MLHEQERQVSKPGERCGIRSRLGFVYVCNPKYQTMLPGVPVSTDIYHVECDDLNVLNTYIVMEVAAGTPLWGKIEILLRDNILTLIFVNGCVYRKYTSQSWTKANILACPAEFSITLDDPEMLLSQKLNQSL